MIDLRQVLFSTSANSFKNTGVYDTSISVSGTVGAGATVEFTKTITLSEDQVFCYAIAEYQDFTRLDGNKWRQIPTFDIYLETTPMGLINWFLYFTIDGPNVTFHLGLGNPWGGTETITPATVQIKYVTYTLAN